MVKNNKKKEIVKDIKENISSSKAIIFYNFHGSENREIFELKKELKKINAHWVVYKNKLARIAIGNQDLNIKGANALIFCRGDEFEPLRVLEKYNKKNRRINSFNGGIYEEKFIDKDLVEQWSKLPSKEILLNNLVYYLGLNFSRMVNVLEKIENNN